MDLYDILLQKQVDGGGDGGSEPIIESLSVTENGTYSVPSGVDGYNPITVNVSSGSGITADDIALRTISGVVSGSATKIESTAFFSCVQITEANFPNATSIGSSAFVNCQSLTTASFPNVTVIGGYAFSSCSNLTTASFPKVTAIGPSGFRACERLESLYLLASSVATLGAYAFMVTPMSSSSFLGHFGSIYVPASLVDSYKSAAGWSAYADRITAYESE